MRLDFGVVKSASSSVPVVFVGIQRTIVTPVANYVLYGGPAINRALGAEAAAKLNQKRNALVTSAETTVMRYVPELSFGIPQRPKS